MALKTLLSLRQTVGMVMAWILALGSMRTLMLLLSLHSESDMLFNVML